MLQMPTTPARQPGPNAGDLLENPYGYPVSIGQGNLTPDGRLAYPENPFAEFFGKPIKQVAAPPETRTHYDHFEAYKDTDNLFLTEYSIRTLTKQDVYLMSEVLPWADGSKMDKLNWWRWEFNQHMLNRRPDEAVSKLLTSQRTAGSEAMVNYGIALEMEYNFYNTPVGRQHYFMQHKQIYLAIMETAAMGAALELLTTEPPQDGLHSTMRTGLTRTEFLQVLRREIAFWNIFVKTENGYKMALSMASDVLAQRGVTPRMAILPRGSAKYIKAARPELRQAHITGRPYDDSVEASLVYNGLKIRESRAFLRGEQQPAYDPHFQWRTIGGFFCMLASHTKNVKPQDYTHDMRKVFQFSEDANDEVPHTLTDALRYCGLVTPMADDGESGHPERMGGVSGLVEFSYRESAKKPKRKIWGLTTLGQRFFARWNTWRDYLEHVGWLEVITNALSGKEGWFPYGNSGGGGGKQKDDDGQKIDDEAFPDEFEQDTGGVPNWSGAVVAFESAANVFAPAFTRLPTSVSAAAVRAKLVQFAQSLSAEKKSAMDTLTTRTQGQEKLIPVFTFETSNKTFVPVSNLYFRTNIVDDDNRRETLRAIVTNGFVAEDTETLAPDTALDILVRSFKFHPERHASLITAWNALVLAMTDNSVKGHAHIGVQSRSQARLIHADTDAIFAKYEGKLHERMQLPADVNEVEDLLYLALAKILKHGKDNAHAERVFYLLVVALSSTVATLRGTHGGTGRKRKTTTFLDQKATLGLVELYQDLQKAVSHDDFGAEMDKFYEAVAKKSQLADAHGFEAFEACVLQYHQGATAGTTFQAILKTLAKMVKDEVFSDANAPNETKWSKEKIQEHLGKLTLRQHGGWLLQYLSENNLQVPLSFILWTPHERFLAGTGLLLVPGRELGATFIGTLNWQMGSDAARKMIFGHFTCQLKSKVLDPKLITRLPNVLITAYGGGAGHTYWDPLSARDVNSYRQNHLAERDIFVTATPPDWQPPLDVMDITGRWDTAWYNDRAIGNPLHYPDGEAYTDHWGFAYGAHQAKQQYETIEKHRHSTVCVQRFCRYYQWTGSANNSGYTGIVESKGHNGERVYPGCANARQGMAMYLEPVKMARKAGVAIVV
jgi:hypothetical protein